MALVNEAKKEINAKIVYIGPKGAGKGTALRQIFSRLKPERRSELKSMAVGAHQMLFFDFSYPAPLRGDGYTVRFHVYTLIAGEDSQPPWKMLLKGVDGVVLFADSTDGRMYANLESCALLMDAVAHYGRKMDDIAISLQCNKRDLQGALPLAALSAELLPESSSAALPVTASTGEGLLDGLNRITREILNNIGQGDSAEGFCQPDAETVPAVAAKISMEPAGERFDHCEPAGAGFSIETAGDPVAIDSSTVVIPLRLVGGPCGKNAEFKLTLSVSC